jgi:hypothetical protein
MESGDSFVLQVRGLRFRVTSANPAVLHAVRFDFAAFQRDASDSVPPDLAITARVGEPPAWGRSLRIGSSRLYWPRGGEQRVALSERSWIAYQFTRGLAAVYGTDAEAAYEACHVTILSYCGERADRDGAHRIHALGIRYGGEACCLLAPSGGGKSTLAAALLQNPAVTLYSDDTPWTEPGGKLSAFALRIALKEKPHGLACREFRRAHYPPKWVIAGLALRDRTAEPAPIRRIYRLYQRPFAGKIVRVARWRFALPLFLWLVIGWETPQIWPLYLRASPRDWLAKAAIAWSRSRRALRLLLSCRTYHFYLGTDAQENAARLVASLTEGPHGRATLAPTPAHQT